VPNEHLEIINKNFFFATPKRFGSEYFITVLSDNENRRGTFAKNRGCRYTAYEVGNPAPYASTAIRYLPIQLYNIVGTEFNTIIFVVKKISVVKTPAHYAGKVLSSLNLIFNFTLL